MLDNYSDLHVFAHLFCVQIRVYEYRFRPAFIIGSGLVVCLALISGNHFHPLLMRRKMAVYCGVGSFARWKVLRRIINQIQSVHRIARRR